MRDCLAMVIMWAILNYSPVNFFITQHLVCIIRDEIHAIPNAVLLSEGQILNEASSKAIHWGIFD